jgi:UDP-glucose 4-epimerase
MKILVTGHRGYIGSRLFKELLDLEHDVTGIDLKDGDDVLYCLPNENYDYVFHLAAFPKVRYSIERPSYTLKQNVLVTSTLLEWAKNHKVKKVIFSSSAAAEECKSPYGLHKKMSEMECKLYSNLYGLDTVCLRYFNVYSEDQPFGGAYSTAISSWMERARLGRPMRIDGDGEQTRDFIHVSDVLLANIFCMQSNDYFGGKIMNVGTGTSISLNKVKSYLESKGFTDWVYAPTRQGDIRHSRADITNLHRIGWSPEISITEGLQKCFGVNK